MTRKTRSRSFYAYYLVFIPLFSAFGLAALFFKERGYFYSVIMFTGSMFLGYAYYSKPKKLANSEYNRNIKLFGREVECNTIFHEDFFQSRNVQSKAEIKLLYDQIIRIKETKNLILIILPENMFIPLDKNRFGNRTAEDFMEFIRSKCSSLKK